MCELASVSRAGYYRFLECEEGEDPDMALRDEIQRIALEFPCYGRRPITAELRHRGWEVNPKRVYRIMREDNLLCLRRRRFVLTTDSAHERPVYPNLAAEMTLTAVNQLWVADITYVRLQVEFVYLAVLLVSCPRNSL
jgi:transposase InsO family protein